jgi:hypothetical protein
MADENIFVMAGGDGLSSPYLNTIENKISKDVIISALKEENKDLGDITDREEESFSVWGYSELSNNLKKNPPQKGDIVFITSNNAAIYIATILEVSGSKVLNYIWAGKQSWKYKLIFENVIQIFIPYPNKGKEEKWFEEHSFSPGVSHMKKVIKCYENGIGFRGIIGWDDTTGPIQGSSKLIVSKDKVLESFAEYCIKTNFECIVKEP